MFEYLIIALLVLWSVAVVFKKILPQTANAALFAVSSLCQHFGWQRLALWIKPNIVTGCGGSCGCASSDADTKTSDGVQAVKWR